MKRYLSLFCLCLLFAGCEKETPASEASSFEGASYRGTVSVIYNDETMDNPDILVDVTLVNGTITLDIHEIKFVPQMPVTVDVSVPGIAYEMKDGRLNFSGDGIVPLSGVVPVERYRVSDLSGYIQGEVCHFSLCFGSYPTEFNGVQIAPAV